jgi:maltose O-acetyltransferase
MGDYIHRATDALLRSELLPVKYRMIFMRKLGYNVSNNSCIWANASFRSKNFKIGENVFINIGFFYDGYCPLSIGDNVRIGQFVKIVTATHDIGPSYQRGLTEVVGNPVKIEDGCWIGCGTIILPGVTVAKGCVIAAGSILTKSTQPDGLYGGSPARLIRTLDP